MKPRRLWHISHSSIGTGSVALKFVQLRTTILYDVKEDVTDRLRAAGVLTNLDDEDIIPVAGGAVDANVSLDANEPEGTEHSSAHQFGRALYSDGWSSTTNRPVLNIMLVSAKHRMRW